MTDYGYLFCIIEITWIIQHSLYKISLRSTTTIIIIISLFATIVIFIHHVQKYIKELTIYRVIMTFLTILFTLLVLVLNIILFVSLSGNIQLHMVVNSISHKLLLGRTNLTRNSHFQFSNMNNVRLFHVIGTDSNTWNYCPSTNMCCSEKYLIN